MKIAKLNQPCEASEKPGVDFLFESVISPICFCVYSCHFVVNKSGTTKMHEITRKDLFTDLDIDVPSKRSKFRREFLDLAHSV